jgi:hypothetical protein
MGRLILCYYGGTEVIGGLRRHSRESGIQKSLKSLDSGSRHPGL